MKGQRQTLLAIGGAVLLVVGAAAQAPVTPRPATPRPNDEAAAPKPLGKLVAPFRGLAPVEFTSPQAKREGAFVVTTFKVKNINNAPLAGFKVDEFWYDKAGNAVTGAPTFRHPRPLQPGDIITVTLKVPTHPQMDRNSYKFAHANGDVKPARVPKL